MHPDFDSAFGRFMLVRRLGLAAPVLAAATLLLVPAPPPDRAGTAPVDAAYVRQHLTAALDDVADHISYERAIITGGDRYAPVGEPALYERWRPADGSSFRLLVSLRGAPLRDLSYDAVSYVDVDYGTRGYVAMPGHTMSTGMRDDVWTPTEVRAALGTGDITWLPPTEATVAMLTTPIPDGFTRRNSY